MSEAATETIAREVHLRDLVGLQSMMLGIGFGELDRGVYVVTERHPRSAHAGGDAGEPEAAADLEHRSVRAWR